MHNKNNGTTVVVVHSVACLSVSPLDPLHNAFRIGRGSINNNIQTSTAVVSCFPLTHPLGLIPPILDRVSLLDRSRQVLYAEGETPARKVGKAGQKAGQRSASKRHTQEKEQREQLQYGYNTEKRRTKKRSQHNHLNK